MKKNIFISLNYAPGLLKEMLAISKQLEDDHSSFLLYLSRGYDWMLEENSNIKFCNSLFTKSGKLRQIIDIPYVTLQIFRTFFNHQCNSCIIYNISIYNSLIFLISCCFGIKKRVLVLHEPYKKKSDIQGLFVKLYFFLAELIQRLPIALSTHIVLMSPSGEEIFRSNFRKYSGEIVGSNLMVPDLLQEEIPIKHRKFYTVVGRFNNIKRIDYFLDFIAWSVKHGNNHNFLIVTSSDISKQIESLPNDVSEVIKIINPDKLSDEVICDALLSSKATMLLQPVITQSGVLPFSFMCGTPVIALNNNGFSQYINNKQNSFLVENPANFEEIQSRISLLESNFEDISINARKTYLSNFHPKNAKKYLSSII
jgi:glycosyltransferase involved in cell wall biosynthesis